MNVQTDIGSILKHVALNVPTTATAAGTGDNTEVTCSVYLDLTARNWPKSAVFGVQYQTNLTEAKTLSISGVVEHSADNSTFATLKSYAKTVQATGASGGSTNSIGIAEIDADLSGAARYVRFKYTPDLNASGTDTAQLIPFVCLAGQYNYPVS